jgi:16S rRNA processing protein RimM
VVADGRWVALAEITRPHGVRGELRVRLYNTDSNLLRSQRDVFVRTAAGHEVTMTFASLRGADEGHLIAKFRGVDDRDGADKLRGAVLCVQRSAFPPPEDGEFYVCDVVGAKLIGPSGELGVVEDLVSYPTADALVLRLAARPAAHAELPLIEDFVESVDVESGLVRVREAGAEFLASTVLDK